MRTTLAAFLILGMATSSYAQDSEVNRVIARPADTDSVVNLPGISGVLPALPLVNSLDEPIGYSLPVAISARPATFRNTLSQLTGSLVGSSQAENSRVMFLYDIGTDDELSKLVNAASDQDKPFLVYVLTRSEGGDGLRGAPVVFLPDNGASWESGVSSIGQASQIANDAISWGISRGLTESGALRKDEGLLLAVPNQIPGLAPPDKVLTSGTADWNVYSDVKLLTDALAAAKQGE